MVQLIAHAVEDGWAFVREGDRILLLRPPYQGSHLAVRPEDVERAVTVHGYLACDLHFNTERDLIQHLRDELVRSWPTKETPKALRDDLLRLADPGEIDIYLDEASAWMHEGRAAEAVILLERLSEAKALTYAQRCRIGSLKEEDRVRQDARQKLKKGERRAQMSTKFRRTHTNRASGAPARGAGSVRPSLLRPAA